MPSASPSQAWNAMGAVASATTKLKTLRAIKWCGGSRDFAVTSFTVESKSCSHPINVRFVHACADFMCRSAIDTKGIGASASVRSRKSMASRRCLFDGEAIGDCNMATAWTAGELDLAHPVSVGPVCVCVTSSTSAEAGATGDGATREDAGQCGATVLVGKGPPCFDTSGAGEVGRELASASTSCKTTR